MTDIAKLPVPPWTAEQTDDDDWSLYDARNGLIAEGLGERTAKFIAEVCNDALLGKLR